MKTKSLIKTSLLCLIIFTMMFPVLPVNAGDGETVTFIVDTTEDIADNAPNGICSAGAITGGPCSLRAAFSEANIIMEMGQNLIIQIPAGLYKLTLTENTGEDAYFGDLDLESLNAPTENWVSIKGAGAFETLINARYIDRAIEIGKHYNVSISDLTITNGELHASEGETAQGAGILANQAGSLVLNNLNMHNNRIHKDGNANSYAFGGAIRAILTPLTIRNSSFFNNWAQYGSAIHSSGGENLPLNIYGSSFYFNKADGAYTLFSYEPFKMINSSVFANEEGMGSLSLVYEAHIQNSTIVNSDNGINISYYDKLYLRNSIILSEPDPNGDTGENCQAMSSKNAAITYAPEIIAEGGNVFSDNSCQPDTNLRDVVVPWEDAGISQNPVGQGILSALPLLPHSPAINRRFEPCLATMTPLDVPVDMPLGVDQFGMPRGMFCDAGALGLQNKSYIFYPLIERE
jgi:CSLREA domain-containing protein